MKDIYLDASGSEMDIPTEAFRSALRGVLEELRTFSHALLIVTSGYARPPDMPLRTISIQPTPFTWPFCSPCKPRRCPVVTNDDASQPINGSFALLVPKDSRS